MPILPNIGRKSLRIKAIISCIYALLIIGSITMLYPFMIMISGSVKGRTDESSIDMVPQFLYSDKTLFSRFMEERYPSLALLSSAYGKPMLRYSDAVPIQAKLKDLESWRRFLQEKGKDFPDHFYTIAEMDVYQRVSPRNFRKFRDELMAQCTDIDSFNRHYKNALASWNDFTGVPDLPLTKEFFYEAEPLMDRYLGFKRSVSASDRVIVNIDGYYALSNPENILVARCPSGPRGTAWADFVKHYLNPLFVRLDVDGLSKLHEYLAVKYTGGISKMNLVYGASYKSFDSVRASYKELRNPAFFTDYSDFVSRVCPVRHMIVDTPSTRYREYMGSRVSKAPIVASEYADFQKSSHGFTIEIVTRNYRNVFQYITVYGRAILNTAIYIGLSILAALSVNPLAAYALSRFRPKATYSLLMFFLITTAFPGAVTMIPNFLLVKNLHLLNTYWALILPGMANGYTIFILKGFFDSIPREVYESAMIDGASEWSLFWRFTMALSKPILALITLGAFTTAYTAFMFALIICPDERMWTLMVWLYQLQQGSQQSMIYAALIIAAIPTLAVFALAQNTIMKGIVIPVEK